MPKRAKTKTSTAAATRLSSTAEHHRALRRQHESEAAQDYCEAIAELLDGSGANLIKIDAEGVTSMILDSMRELILQRRPELIIEVLTLEEPQLNALDWLLEAYDLHRLSASGPLAQPRFNAHESERDFWLQPRPASAANVPKAAPLTQP